MTEHQPQHRRSLSLAIIQLGAPWVIIGILSLISVLLGFATGCGNPWQVRHAQVQQELQRHRGEAQQQRLALEKERLVRTRAEGELEAARSTLASKQARAEQLETRLAVLEVALSQRSKEALEQAANARDKALSQCQSLPGLRTMERRIRRERRGARILAKRRGGTYLLAVTLDRPRGQQASRLTAWYQGKTQTRLMAIPLQDQIPRGTALEVGIRPFLGRFLEVRVTARAPAGKRQVAVGVRHYILRPTSEGAELACRAKGDARYESRESGVTTLARQVSFLPVPRADAPTFQLKVEVPRLPVAGADALDSADSTPPSTRYWTYVLGSEGTCQVRQADRRVAPRNALEGLF